MCAGAGAIAGADGAMAAAAGAALAAPRPAAAAEDSAVEAMSHDMMWLRPNRAVARSVRSPAVAAGNHRGAVRQRWLRDTMVMIFGHRANAEVRDLLASGGLMGASEAAAQEAGAKGGRSVDARKPASRCRVYLSNGDDAGQQ